MRQCKIAIGSVATVSCFITFLLYYWHRANQTDYQKTSLLDSFKAVNQFLPQRIITPDLFQEAKPFRHMPLNEVYPDGNKAEASDELVNYNTMHANFINTPGCKLPIALVHYTDNKKRTVSCGKRAVFLKKISGDEVKATIKEKIVKTYLRKSAYFECCFRFIMGSSRVGEENRKIRYTPCEKFQDGAIIKLESDFINIKCFEQRKNISHEVYDDVYAFTKMINVTKKPSRPCKHRYNILLLGIDSMSLSRFVQVMHKSTSFFHENYWLGYRAFHKIGDNTIPNLMAVLTGLNMSATTEKCAKKMHKCKKMFIWNTFREEGYVTAYGEDYLRLPDTFHGDYQFKRPPTHHYLRPLYVNGETELLNKSLVCAGKVPSAQQLLDYALDFAITYRFQSFFGIFWMNSFSHNENSRPQDADNMIENFLNRLSYTGLLDNTFIFFFSDHGVRFGAYRMQIQSYYDERTPFLFTWAPNSFKGYYVSLYNSLARNQYRLVTPYDLYNTLSDIHRIAVCDRPRNNTEIISVSEGCPKCHSLFRIISENRTCHDAAIDDKWCSCHAMYPLDVDDTEALMSVNLIVSYIKNMSRSVKTKHCWGCMPLDLRNVIRIHFYYDVKVNLYNVVALTMTPGNVSYEAVVKRRGDSAEMLGSVSVISPYRGLGRCTIDPKARVFCVCQKIKNCF